MNKDLLGALTWTGISASCMYCFYLLFRATVKERLDKREWCINKLYTEMEETAQKKLIKSSGHTDWLRVSTGR